MTLEIILEYFAAGLNLAFVLLLIKEKVAAWPIGILASAFSMVLFFQGRLYAETFSYLIYTILGIYGWWFWAKKTSQQAIFVVREWRFVFHFVAIVIAIGLSYSVGYLLSEKTEARNAYFDSTTTVFSMLATFLEARKILSAWVYWTILNSASAYLYYQSEMNLMAIVMLIYIPLSAYGFYKWFQSYKEFQNA